MGLTLDSNGTTGTSQNQFGNLPQWKPSVKHAENPKLDEIIRDPNAAASCPQEQYPDCLENAHMA
jgi:hypothetical protein